jgi:membrane protease YdiL (CAAX protease family)
MVGTSRASPPPTDRGTVARYAVGVAVVVLVIASQYFVPQIWPASRFVYSSLAGDLVLVYGLPIVAFTLLVGVGPLRNWRANPRRAIVQGLGWYGATGLLALLVTVVLAIVYELLDPAALDLLSKPNPALQSAASDPWFWVGFSFVVGALEETIFRGWIFGFWMGRTDSWLTPAILSSVLFAGVHLYYGTTYGLGALLIFPTLFLLGFAFAATYRYSGGNLVVTSALHGANDGAAYLMLVSVTAGTVLRYGLILVGAAVGLAYYLKTGRAARQDTTTAPKP